MRKRDSIFVRYLMSYVAAMLIPMLVLGYISYNYFLSFYTHSLEQSKADTLSTFQLTMDMQLMQLQQNASMISAMREYSTDYLLQSYAQFFDLKRSLSNICSPNNFLYDMHFLNNDLGYIYTPLTRFDFASYAGFGTTYDELTEAELTAMLTGLDGPLWIPTQRVSNGREQVLSYIVPTARGRSGVTGAVIFLISKQMIDNISGSPAAGTSTKMLMVDSDHSVLYVSSGSVRDAARALPDTFWDALDEAPPNAPFRRALDDGKSIAYIFDSQITNLKYISVIDYAEIIQPLEHLKFLFFVGIIAVTVIGGFAILYFMNMNYRPIRSLSRLSKTLLDANQGNVDDLKAVELAITTIHRRNTDITSINHQMQRERLLLDLLRGAHEDMEQFSVQAHALDMYLEGPSFRIAICYCGRRNHKTEMIGTISRFLESSLSASADLETYVVEYTEDDSVIAFLSGGSEGIQSADQLLREAAKNLSGMFGGLKIGLSECYAQLERSRVHYRQALAAVKYRTAEEGQDVICFSETVMASVSGVYPSDGLTALYNAIQMGDPARIEFAVDMLLPYFNNVGSLFFIMCLGYDIVNTALRAMREINYPYFQFNKKYPELLLESRIDSADEVIRIVKMLSMEICSYINQGGDAPAPKTREADDIAAVLDFIQEHYTDSNFSAKTLAAHFGMSVSNFSHYFKNRTGTLVSGHIAALRLEKAKELLRASDMTVAEIADASGYCHVSTLMRQFKSSESTTPSLYRSQYHVLLPPEAK